MSLFKLIKTTLTPLNIPTFRLTLTEEESSKNYDEYITVTEYNQQGELFADDEELATSHSIQISLFSRKNYINTVEEIKELLKTQGFTRTNEYETYEDNTGYYHKIIRFNYNQEVV